MLVGHFITSFVPEHYVALVTKLVCCYRDFFSQKNKNLFLLFFYFSIPIIHWALLYNNTVNDGFSRLYSSVILIHQFSHLPVPRTPRLLPFNIPPRNISCVDQFSCCFAFGPLLLLGYEELQHSESTLFLLIDFTQHKPPKFI